MKFSRHSGSWNIYIAMVRGLWESKAWWLEPHSKETDKDPEDSCGAALSHTKTKKKYRKTAGEKIP